MPRNQFRRTEIPSQPSNTADIESPYLNSPLNNNSSNISCSLRNLVGAAMGVTALDCLNIHSWATRTACWRRVRFIPAAWDRPRLPAHPVTARLCQDPPAFQEEEDLVLRKCRPPSPSIWDTVEDRLETSVEPLDNIPAPPPVT